MPATLTFDDEFNSLSLWNGSSGKWSTTPAYEDDRGNGSSLPSNGEQEWYINSNYAPTASVRPWTVNNGVLTLTAQKADPSIVADLGYAKSGTLGGYQYTSGLLETNHSFNQTYGYFEMKAQLPAAQGAWPAFWLMPTNGAWPPELDVVEALGKDTSTIYTTVHTDQSGSHTYQALATSVGDYSSSYHTYAVDWEADKITFFYDNKQVYQVDTPADMHGPMYMIANLALGGGWAGNVTDPNLHAQMNIDYIKAWTSNPYAGAVASGSAGVGWDTASTAVHDVLRVDPTGSDLLGLATQVSAGTAPLGQLTDALLGEARGTSSVATLTYQFFTGTAPTAAGMDYLVSPQGGDPNNLNSASFQQFNLENRYIDFAVALGKEGAGSAAFAEHYGNEDLFGATRQAYAAIFGAAASDAKIHQLLDAQVPGGAGLESRADYFASYGMDGANGLGTKAAMVGWLLAEAVKDDVGVYAHSNAAFLTDVATHHAGFGVDVLAAYAQPGFTIGSDWLT